MSYGKSNALAAALLEAVSRVRLEDLEEAIGEPASAWDRRCHEISLKALRTGLYGEGRVARGLAKRVSSQHSWIVIGSDPWDPAGIVVDPTIWHYYQIPPSVHFCPNTMTSHRPHGTGSIWDYGAPPSVPARKAVRLKSHAALSSEALAFLEACGPMDRRGWMFLANAPVQEWPAREILEAIADDPQLGPSLIPIDHLGMVTGRNPGGLYW